MQTPIVQSVNFKGRVMLVVSLLSACFLLSQANNASGVGGLPCIGVTKSCDTVSLGQPNLVTAVVTNCGLQTLFNITVSDNLYGTIGTIASLAPSNTATVSKLVTNTCGSFPNIVIATGNNEFGETVSATASSTCTVTANPCIGVAKTCNTVTVGQDNTITVTVVNCGNVTLNNIAVVDDLFGSIGNLLSLATGASATFTKLVTTNTCGNFTNVVTAIADSACGTPVLARDTNVCVVTEHPCIRVTKNCIPAPLGQPNQLIVTVENCGDVNLLFLLVVDDLYGPIGVEPGLAVGQTRTFSKLVTNLNCGNFTNVVTATAETFPCHTPVQDTDTNFCVVICPTPRICVTKEVAVFDPTNGCSEAWSHLIVVTNATDSNACPSFCYRVTVRNCGSDVLTNVTVVDSVLDLGCGFPDTLAVGDTVVCTVGGVVHCCTVTNTITASGTGVFRGDSTNASDTAAVVVEDHQAPEVSCVPGVNPSGKKIPVAGKNPSSGQNPDGYYELLAKDNCSSDVAIYLADTGSSFIAGPFASGDVIKLTQSPGKTPSQSPAPDPIVAHVHLKGDGLLFAVDANGNTSEPVLCLVPRHPK